VNNRCRSSSASWQLGLQLSEIVGVTACFVVLDASTAGLRHRRWP
jgi:hypothetical protein